MTQVKWVNPKQIFSAQLRKFEMLSAYKISWIRFQIQLLFISLMVTNSTHFTVGHALQHVSQNNFISIFSGITSLFGFQIKSEQIEKKYLMSSQIREVKKILQCHKIGHSHINK